jgi:hypothetical protein
VYCGETETGDSSAVYLYDLSTSQTTAIVPGKKTEGYFSIPNFYRDNIIYIQNNMLWAVEFDGSNRRVLFPASKQGDQ